MQTINNEQSITTFADCIKLTTHRIRYEDKSVGCHEVIAIMLSEVTSCTMIHRSIPLLLALAAFLLFGGSMAFTDSDLTHVGMVALALGGLLVFAYFSSRRQILSIASSGAIIRVTIAGNSVAEAIQFIDTLENAKHSYFSGSLSDPQDVTLRDGPLGGAK